MLKLLLAFLLSTVLLSALTTVYADTHEDVLPPGNWYLYAVPPGNAMQETVAEASAPAAGDVLRVTVTTPTSPTWNIQFIKQIQPTVAAGDVLQLSFWARSATLNPLRVTIEQSAPPYEGITGADLTLGSTWQHYSLSGTVTDIGPSGLSAHFQLGRQVGVIEFAGIGLIDTGNDPNLAAARLAVTPSQIDARIDKYRKGQLTIRVVDSQGHAVNKATVQISQTKHAFLFGCNFFGLNPADTSPTQIAYQNEFASLFNYATLPFYWGSFEPQQGQKNYAQLDAMANWCEAHGITSKGHPLVWHQVWPSWAPTDPDAARPLIQARITDLITHYGKTVHYWDVVNEANGAADFTPANGESNWISRDGPDSL